MGVSTCQISTHGPNDDFLPTNVTNFSGAEYWAQPKFISLGFLFWGLFRFFCVKDGFNLALSVLLLLFLAVFLALDE